MGKVEDADIRKRILKYLYDDRREKPGGMGIQRSLMLDLLKLRANPDIMDFHMLYLEEKRLIKLEKTVDSLWAEAKLTALGVDTVESWEKNS